MGSGIFAQFDQKDLNNIAARGILEKLKETRQKIGFKETARRLIWELIQNAKDNAYVCKLNGSTNVKIRIKLINNKFIFEHDNGYFTNDNIRAIIRRNSSDDKDSELKKVKDNVTGKFGTGFMTTHLLSEKVTIKGLFQHESSFKSFEFELDRTGQTKEEIIIGINKAFEQVEECIKKHNDNSVNLANYNTSFIYELNEEGIEVAKLGLEEIKNNIGIVLLNIPSISNLEIIENEKTYKYFIKIIDNYEINKFKLFKLFLNDSTLNNYLWADKLKFSITIPIDFDKNCFLIKQIDENTPRLFLDFPLIGTEILKLPFIINSTYFEPIETRDGVSLTNSYDRITAKNKELIINAKNLYLSIVEYLTHKNNWYNLYNLARIGEPDNKKWLDNYWYKNNIINDIIKKITELPIVETIKGKQAIEKDGAYVDFIRYKDENKRKNLYNICKNFNYYILPIYEHLKYWDEILWTKKYDLNLETLVSFLNKIECIDNLKKNISSDVNEYVLLDNIYNFVYEQEAKFNYTIYVNQLGEFCDLSKLYIPEDLDDTLIDIAEELGIDVRKKLLNKNITRIKDLKKMDMEYLTNQIERKILHIWKTNERVNHKEIMMNLFYWIRNNEQKAKELFTNIYPQHFLLIDDEQLFNKVTKADALDTYLKINKLTYDDFEKLIKDNKKQTKQNKKINVNTNINDENKIENTITDSKNQNKDAIKEYEEKFSKFEEIPDKKFLENEQQFNKQFFIKNDVISFEDKLYEIIESLNSKWKGYIYHFTHVENAKNIIASKKLLARNYTKFVDSAGKGYIQTTENIVKDYVRFYFRPLTPTQYYNEGLGRLTKNQDLPQCPVPVFFKFNLKEVLKKYMRKCYISNGNLRHYPAVQFGNDSEILKKFNFENLYAEFGNCEINEFLVASQQEFIIQREFDFSDIKDYSIICRNESDKETLMALLKEDDIDIKKIIIDEDFYYNYNRFVNIDLDNSSLNIEFAQVYEDEHLHIVINNNNQNLIIQTTNSLNISHDGLNFHYEIYYISPYKQKWLVFKNDIKNN